MNWKLLLCILLVGCASASRQHHRHKHSPSLSRTDVISADTSGVLVPGGWVARYKSMEKKAGGIPEDSDIYMEGEHYRIPQEVANHFNNMVRAERH